MDNKVKTILTKVIDTNFIMTLGTIVDNKPHLATVFYVNTDYKNLYFKSRTQSAHSLAFAKNPSAAVTIYNPKSNYSVKSGVQLRGSVQRVKNIKEMGKVIGLYGKSFAGSEKKFSSLPELISDFVASTMYKFIIEEVKVMDSELEVHSESYTKVK